MIQVFFRLFHKTDSKNRFGMIRFLAAILLPALNSCSVDPALIDRSFLTEETCKAPCWYGLEIDKSTKADILAKLDQLPFVEHNTYKEYGTVWMNDQNAKEIQFHCLNQPDEFCGGALISNNILKSLWLRVGYDLSFKQAVNKLGPPDFLEYEQFSMSGKCRIDLLWIESGIDISSYENGSQGCQSVADGNGVSPNKLVAAIFYFAREGFGEPGTCCKRIPWPGFAKQEQ
jgi:hypothetical protein